VVAQYSTGRNGNHGVREPLPWVIGTALERHRVPYRPTEMPRLWRSRQLPALLRMFKK
jgi:hypothetical protein